MGMETERLSLCQILKRFNKIIIPDVQRDYVMGSGGKKLTKLFSDMIDCKRKEEKFDFSCLVGYKDYDNNLYIYDGQQRLVTLVCLCSVQRYDDLYKKFTFIKRDKANEWILNTQDIRIDDVVDFTTYSLAKLVDMFNSPCLLENYRKNKPVDVLSVDFLINNVYFDVVLVDEISDAEQFFLDINDGLDLKYYEIYKAELYHYANQLLDERSFKRFALKMENEWLKFFLAYRHYENKWVNEEYKEVVVHDEEEILVLFLKYCFRMMWIEEKNNDDEFEISGVSWLEKEHFERIERIIDSITYITKDAEIPKCSCINYSVLDILGNKGQHWNITDTNYISMLDIFLRNIYKTEETKKDVVIWCYISNLSESMQNIDELYNYLRLVKKVLNHKRKESKMANIFFNDGDNKIVYARYYVQAIPMYYLSDNVDKENDDDYLNYLNDVIIMNKEVNLKEWYLFDFLGKNKNMLLESVLEKEKKKQNSDDRRRIREYENYPYINGLVDNFVNYTENSCKLKEWAQKLFENEKNNFGYQYKKILKYIYENQIDIKSCVVSDVSIKWRNYCGTINNKKVSLIIHTWCDLYTCESKEGITFLKNSYLNYLPLLPEGWISEDKKIIRPMNTGKDKKPGFESYQREEQVFDMSGFLINFSWICASMQEGKYIINDKEEKGLPSFLNNYNDGNWIVEKLCRAKKIFYSDKDYLNKILLYKFKEFRQNRGEDVDTYLEKNQGKMQFVEMEGENFFIKLEKI